MAVVHPLPVKGGSDADAIIAPSPAPTKRHPNTQTSGWNVCARSVLSRQANKFCGGEFWVGWHKTYNISHSAKLRRFGVMTHSLLLRPQAATFAPLFLQNTHRETRICLLADNRAGGRRVFSAEYEQNLTKTLRACRLRSQQPGDDGVYELSVNVNASAYSTAPVWKCRWGVLAYGERSVVVAFDTIALTSPRV